MTDPKNPAHDEYDEYDADVPSANDIPDSAAVEAAAREAAAKAKEDEAVREALLARTPYLLPAGISNPRGRVQRVPAAKDLVTSYLDQVHTWASNGFQLIVDYGIAATDEPAETASETDRPTDRDGRATTLDLQLPEPMTLLTAWNPFDQPHTIFENEQANHELAQAIAATGATILDKIVTTESQRAWLEDTFAVTGLDIDQAAAIARDFGQPAFTTVGTTTATVRSSGLIAFPTVVGGVVSRRLAPQTCPMRSDNIPAARCALHGGPWVSASVHAAIIWKAHRGLLMSRLGCIPCNGGYLPTLGKLGRAGGPIALADSQLILGSRYGGYVWRD